MSGGQRRSTNRRIGLYRTRATAPFPHAQGKPISTPAPTAPFGTDTLCTMQKQTNLTNSLLQDITVFNEHDWTKSEEWLRDLERAADLTNESWAKLAKAKSRGLTNTLVTDAINAERAWDEIKDLLRLKLHNANIHTYTSCFMDIQQWEKESIAAYVCWFKMEAKQCNFTNDAATIRIFVKELKNAHSLVACIYEKVPQTLTDAIREVEKFNTVQQLTMTILPSSAVNMMSNEKTDVFNVKSWDTLQDTALTSDVTNVMSTDISSWLLLTKYLLWEQWQHTTRHIEVTAQDPAQGTIRKIGKEGTTLDHILYMADITALAIMTCT